jgi:hypothetical protein
VTAHALFGAVLGGLLRTPASAPSPLHGAQAMRR